MRPQQFLSLKIDKRSYRYTYNKYYTSSIFDINICVYCGELSEELDHVPPLSILRKYTVEDLKNEGAPFIKVPSCRECNGILYDKELLTLKVRKQYLIEYYKKKYKNSLNEFSLARDRVISRISFNDDFLFTEKDLNLPKIIVKRYKQKLVSKQIKTSKDSNNRNYVRLGTFFMKKLGTYKEQYLFTVTVEEKDGKNILIITPSHKIVK